MFIAYSKNLFPYIIPIYYSLYIISYRLYQTNFQSMGAAPKYMGYVMAGYALGGIISAPLYGYIGVFFHIEMFDFKTDS